MSDGADLPLAKLCGHGRRDSQYRRKLKTGKI
jgi:hypothetical protein